MKKGYLFKLILAFGMGGWISVHSQTKPNILFFLVDDMGWQDTEVPFHTDTTSQNRLYKTPNMTKLALSGIRFSNAYAHQVCSPSRISLMTGMSAVRHHVTNWTLHPGQDQSNTSTLLKSPTNWNTDGLTVNDTAYTLPALLKKNGYYTIHAGKAHFGVVGEFNENPTNLGFDVNIAGHAPGAPGSYQGTDNYASNSVWDVPGLDAYHGTTTHLTEAITLEAIKEITNAVNANKPFYMYMAHYAVHTPIQKHDPYYQTYLNQGLSDGQAKYASLVEGMDVSLGDLMDHIETLGESENTIVVFYSDNGGLRSVTNNSPLREGKGQIYEGGTRVPMIVSWAKPAAQNKFAIAPHVISDKIVIIEDFLPTLLSWADVTIPTERLSVIEGENITGFITQDPTFNTQRESIFFHFPHRHTGMHASAMRKGDYKIIHYYEDGRWELYNLKDDIGESNNLAASNLALTYQLGQELVAGLEVRDVQYPALKSNNQPQPVRLPADPGPYVILNMTSPLDSTTWVRGSQQTLTWTSVGDNNVFTQVDLSYLVGDDNQRLTGTMTGSSNNGATLLPELANDGDPATRWAASSTQTSDFWLEVDFGENKTFNMAKIQEVTTWGQRINEYDIQVWNGNSWQVAFSNSVPSGIQVDRFTQVTGSKARLFIKTVHANFPTISEFGVYFQEEVSLGSIPNSGSYTWAVPDSLQDFVQFKIKSAASETRSGWVNIVDQSAVKDQLLESKLFRNYNLSIHGIGVVAEARGKFDKVSVLNILGEEVFSQKAVTPNVSWSGGGSATTAHSGIYLVVFSGKTQITAKRVFLSRIPN